MTTQVLTRDICLGDLTSKDMEHMARNLREALNFLCTSGAEPESIHIHWREIDPKISAIDATIGFFIVSGNIATKGNQ